VALRTAFYCTDSEPFRNRVLFYRRPVWNRLKAHSLSQLTAPVTTGPVMPLLPLNSCQPVLTFQPAGAVATVPGTALPLDSDSSVHQQYVPMRAAEVTSVFSAPMRQLGFAPVRLVPRVKGG